MLVTRSGSRRRAVPPSAGSLARSATVLLLAALTMLVPGAASAVQVAISPSRDNTLYEPAAAGQYTSNGAGEPLFSGRTKNGFIRRTVIRFDVGASIPAGSTINSATLQMRVSRVSNNTLRATSLYRLLADWGEGTSNADQQEGQGTTPTTGDATWIHRYYPGTLWAAPGGDFNATAAATVNGIRI